MKPSRAKLKTIQGLPMHAMRHMLSKQTTTDETIHHQDTTIDVCKSVYRNPGVNSICHGFI